MRTHIQARLVTLQPRHNAHAQPALYLALRMTQVTHRIDPAGVSIPVVAHIDRLVQLGGVA
jgi:hypothetical protein